MALTNQKINIAGREYAMRKSAFTTNLSPVHVSDSMTGKMAGIPSISTSCICNPICQKRMTDNNSICSKCFAAATVGRYDNMTAALESNYYLFNESVLNLDLLPRFGNVRFVRLESFGDCGSVTHAINFINLCKVNPDITFACWTKNPRFYDAAFQVAGGKPDNLIMVISSPIIGKVAEKKYAWIDKIFTVYSADQIEKGNIDINCGARCCMTCRRCYDRRNTETYVSEKLK